PPRPYELSIPAAPGTGRAAARGTKLGRIVRPAGLGMTTSFLGPPGGLYTDRLVSSRRDEKAPRRSPSEHALEVLLEVLQAGLEHLRVLPGLRQNQRALRDGHQVVRQGLRAPAGPRRVGRFRLLEVAPEVGALLVKAVGAHAPDVRMAVGQLLDEGA